MNTANSCINRTVFVNKVMFMTLNNLTHVQVLIITRFAFNLHVCFCFCFLFFVSCFFYVQSSWIVFFTLQLQLKKRMRHNQFVTHTFHLVMTLSSDLTSERSNIIMTITMCGHCDVLGKTSFRCNITDFLLLRSQNQQLKWFLHALYTMISFTKSSNSSTCPRNLANG